jgi:hypothetical protein
MNRLPINLLLYVAILGLAGGSGWQFYQALVVEGKTPEQRRAEHDANRDRFQKSLARGTEAAGKVVVGPNYGGSREFWDALRNANFNGAEPPPPPPPPGEDDRPKEPVAVPQTPLADIFVLTCVMGAGPDSRAVIRYKPTATVEIPAELLPPAAGAGLDAVPGAVSRTPRMPTYGDNLGPAHHVPLDGPLWKPYDHIHLVRVERNHAVFVRRDPKIPEDEWKEEKIYKEALELPQDVLQKLAEGLGREVVPSGDGPGPEGPAQASGWVAMDLTQEVAPGRFNVGSRDRQLFGNDPDRIFNQDVGTADWRSQNGSMRGVRITKLAPGYERYGLREGEILVALNGEPVSGKTEALRVGRRLYDRGVRTFDAQFLTATGQTINRTYVAPDDR